MSNTENLVVDFSFAEQYDNIPLGDNAAIIHKDFTLISTESANPFRSRLRGRFTTLDIQSYIDYVKSRLSEDGAEAERTFIYAEEPQNSLSSVTALNFGSYNTPGHADDVAVLELRKDPLFADFLSKTASWSSATDFAEILEDYLGAAEIAAYNNETAISFAKAIVGIRNAKIDRNSSSTLNTGALNYEQSDMEKIAIQAQAEILPTELQYVTGMYLGLEAQTISFRVVTRFEEKDNGGTKVHYRLKPVGILGHYLKAAVHFQELIGNSLENTLIGTYKK